MILPPLNTLQAFEAAARHSSLSKAGGELNVTHAAISGQIKRLEEWLGRKLFVRAGRGVVLTAAGEELRITVQASLAAISLTSQTLRRRKDRKTLSVACVPSIATRWLIPALPEFTRAHPAIEIRVFYGTAMEDFDPERHDVLINNREMTSGILRSTKLFSRMNRPVASPIYLQRSCIDMTFDGANLLHDETQADWEDWFARAGFRPLVVTHGPIYQDFNLLATAVIAGHGIALCPVEVFRRELIAGDLVIMSDVATRDDQGYFVTSDQQRTPVVNTFIRWFENACSSTAA